MTTPIPAGWKLVPIDPTETMVVCGFESRPDPVFSKPEEWEAFDAMTGCQQAAHKARLCYAAMPDASPTPPSVAPGDAQDEQPYCYVLETRGRRAGINDVLLDVEYNGTDNFSGGRTGGIPLYRRSDSVAAEALQFLADTEGAIESLTLGGETRYRVWWPAVGEIQGDWFKSPEAAIAAAAQVPQQGEA